MDGGSNQSDGFSLLELSAVLFIVMILLGVSLPRFSLMFESQLKQEALKIARIVDELRWEAIFKGETHKIIFDTEESEISVLTAQPAQPTQFSENKKFPKPIPIQKPVELRTVSFGEPRSREDQFGGKPIEFDKIFGQKFEVKIDSSGFVDLFTVRLSDKKDSLGVSTVNVMGKIFVGEPAPL